MNFIKPFYLACITILLLTERCVAASEKKQVLLQPVTPTFSQVASTETNDDVEFKLINGWKVDPRLYPAILQKVSGKPCTAVIVGPKTILLAAHCINSSFKIAFRSVSRTIQGECESSTNRINDDASNDWALCLLEEEVEEITPESININMAITPGTQLLLTGYGCSSVGVPTDNLLRFGYAFTVSKPINVMFPDEESTIYTRRDDTRGPAIICPGDSGGPAFFIRGNQYAAREIVAINSRVNLRSEVSLLSATNSSRSKEFFNTWINKHNTTICGINQFEFCR